MNQISQRANIFCKDINSKPVVIYEDHRTLLTVLWHAFENDIFNRSNAPNLICFDLHDDGRDPTNVMEQIEQFRSTPPTSRDFSSFVEWDLCFLDDDWLKAALELGLINDVVLVGTEKKGSFDHGLNVHIDHLGNEHHIWCMGHIWSELEYQGDLSDISRREKLQVLWDILGWQCSGGTFDFTSENRPILLDFDLDCFTVNIAEATLAWPYELIINRFAQTSNYNPTRSWSAGHFVRHLASLSPIITIARESECSGGMLETQIILEALDKILFNEQLFSK